MHIAILGRQPAISIAELERIYGSDAVRWFSDQSATIDASDFDFERLGGSQKAGRVVMELPQGDWRRVSMKIVQHYQKEWSAYDGKITLGISAYGFDIPARDIQKTGIILKQKLKQSSANLRLIPNAESALNTATSHHNKLGLAPNKVELLVVRSRSGRIIVASSIGAQNITALARRDQERPKRDAFVGMLPPKLARIIVNLAAGDKKDGVVLDPFCGTGVVLQEAHLLGFNIIGSDLSEKMVDYTEKNLLWLMKRAPGRSKQVYTVSQGDATEYTWQPPIDIVATETYLGQPFSAPPSSAKLTEVRGTCNHIVRTFLKNIGAQIQHGTPVCLAVPAWRSLDGSFTHLSVISELESLGYEQIILKNAKASELLYFREDQIVARELLILKKA